MNKTIFIVSVVLSTILAAVWAASTYDTRYDNFDVDSLLANDRILTSYVNCMLDKGPCTSEGKLFKRSVEDEDFNVVEYEDPYQYGLKVPETEEVTNVHTITSNVDLTMDIERVADVSSKAFKSVNEDSLAYVSKIPNASEDMSTVPSKVGVVEPNSKSNSDMITEEESENCEDPHEEDTAEAETIPEGLATSCGKCSPKQKEIVRKVIKALQERHLDQWNLLEAKYDTRKYKSQIESFLNSDS